MFSTTASYFTAAAAVDWPSSHESFSMITTMISPDEATFELRPEPLKVRQESILLPPTPHSQQSSDDHDSQVGSRPVALKLWSRDQETQSPTLEQSPGGTPTLRHLHSISRRAGARRHGRMRKQQSLLDDIPSELATVPPVCNTDSSPKTPISDLDLSSPLPVIFSPPLSPTSVSRSFRVSTHEMSLFEALRLDSDASTTKCDNINNPITGLARSNSGTSGTLPLLVESDESQITFTNPWDTSQPLFHVTAQSDTPTKETSFMNWDSSDDEDHKGFSIRKNSALKGWKSRNASRSRPQLSSKKVFPGITSPTAPIDAGASTPITVEGNVQVFSRKGSEASITSAHGLSSPVSQTSFVVQNGISSPMSQTTFTLHNGLSSPVSQASFLQNCASSPVSPSSFSTKSEASTPKSQVSFSTQDPRNTSWSATLKKKSSFLRDRKFSHGNSSDTDLSKSASERAPGPRLTSPLSRTESETRIPTIQRTRPAWFRKVSI